MVVCARRIVEGALSRRFRPYHPEQSFLLPPSPSEWLAEGHLAYSIADIVYTLEMDCFYAPYVAAKDCTRRYWPIGDASRPTESSRP